MMTTHTRVLNACLPLQALVIAPHEETRRRILTGEKQITIRGGWRDYRPGPVMLCSHLVPWCVWAKITDVRLCTLMNVTDEEMAAEGCDNFSDLVALLRHFYPEIESYSPVTVIRWANVSGRLVDNEVEVIHDHGSATGGPCCPTHCAEFLYQHLNPANGVLPCVYCFVVGGRGTLQREES